MENTRMRPPLAVNCDWRSAVWGLRLGCGSGWLHCEILLKQRGPSTSGMFWEPSEVWCMRAAGSADRTMRLWSLNLGMLLANGPLHFQA